MLLPLIYILDSGALVQPLVLGVHWTTVFFPADDGLWQTVDLALESGHTRLLGVHWLWLDMEICHSCESERRLSVPHIIAQLQALQQTCIFTDQTKYVKFIVYMYFTNKNVGNHIFEIACILLRIYICQVQDSEGIWISCHMWYGSKTLSANTHLYTAKAILTPLSSCTSHMYPQQNKSDIEGWTRDKLN